MLFVVDALDNQGHRRQSIHLGCLRRCRDHHPPCTKGPRLIRTTAERPLLRLTTVTFVPNGSVRCAAVMAPERICSPLAGCWSLYTEAMSELPINLCAEL